MKRLIVSVLPLLLLALAGCRKDPPELTQPPEVVTRTLLVYLAMDNNIGSGNNSYADRNIDDLRKGTTAAALNGGRIIVYKDVPMRPPVLLEIRMGRQGKTVVDTLRRYTDQNSASAEVFRAVLDEVKALAPARSYGLDIGSHATGWIPGWFDMSIHSRRRSVDPQWLTRATANDGSQWMELENLSDVLADNELEYILFDACFMGGIESIYALRNKAEHIVASPAEVLIAGMPYDRIVGDLMASTPNLRGVCEKYYAYYPQSAAIALYDCSKMGALVEAMRPIYARDMAGVMTMNTDQIQRLTSVQLKTLIFDLADFAAHLMPAADPLYATLRAALDLAVPYKAVTPTIMGDTPVDPAKFCGMATYIPTDRMDVRLNIAWMETQWARDVLR